MSYRVQMRDAQTGEVRMLQLGLDWGDGEGQRYWWTDGNFGCDCNRAAEWIRATGREPTDEELDAAVCSPFDGPQRYAVDFVELPDGRRISIDGASA